MISRPMTHLLIPLTLLAIGCSGSGGETPDRLTYPPPVETRSQVVLGFGDSITFRPDSWCNQIPWCQAHGVPGETSREGVDRLLSGSVPIEGHRVILSWGVNDLRSQWTLSTTLDPIEEAVLHVLDHGGEPVLWIPTPQMDAASGEWHPVANPRITETLGPAIVALAEHYGLRYVDAYGAIGTEVVLFDDYTHPNEIGQWMIAQEVIRVLEEDE